MTDRFSSERFVQVTRRTLLMNRRTYILGFGGAIVGVYALWLLAMLFGVGPAEAATSALILGIGILIYHVAGYVLTATIFSELQSPDSASQLLTLPATAREKLISSWVISFLIYSLFTFAALSALLLLMYATAGLFFGQSVNFTSTMASIEPISNILSYMLYNSIFMLGAVFFRGNNFLKTAFTILLFSLFIGIQIILLINIFTPEPSQYFSLSLPLIMESDLGMLLFKLLYTVPITALFLTFSYFRLKNRQVV